MTIELTSAYSAKADAGFATAAMLLQSTFSRCARFHLAENGSDALRDNGCCRENAACSPVVR
jgi:hypothetical protein